MTDIFVFGSNLLGIHGAGAARHAKDTHNAKNGISAGRTGNAYAIPTKRRPTMKPYDILSINEIKPHVNDFIKYANAHPELTFKITRIGCGLAGYKDHQIGPLFKGAPNNCHLPDQWKKYV